MQDYLQPNMFPADLAKFTFLCRSRLLTVGENYRQGQNMTTCPLCQNYTEADSQLHLLKCVKLNSKTIVNTKSPVYEDLFGQSIDRNLIVAAFLKRNYSERVKLISEKSSKTAN